MAYRNLLVVLTFCCVVTYPLTQANHIIARSIRSSNLESSKIVYVRSGETTRAVLPPNTQLEIRDSAIAFSELELNDGCVIYFHPSLKSVNLTVVKFILHGKSTIDLTPRIGFPNTPPKPQGQGQAHNDPPTQRGADGTPGTVGADGSNGVELNLSIQTLVATDGSLWVKTDGTVGGQGSDGGDAGKGAGPKTSGFNCYDGGDGGTGGRGGNGGKGGNTAKVKLKVGSNTISPTQASGVAPSSRPAAADITGTIVIQGAPGAGGNGGRGGRGGDGGEGRDCSFPASDANPGRSGSPGANGSTGQNGGFVA